MEDDNALYDTQWKALYNDMKLMASETLKAIGQQTINALYEINERRDRFGKLSQIDELAYDDYAMYLDVITYILLERSISL